MIHVLKTIQPYFDYVDLGNKTFEVRKNDRDFKVGDIMALMEYEKGVVSGKQINCIITYILDNQDFCKEGYVVIGFKKL